MTLRSRIAPCLLMQDGDLVKTKKFKNPIYIGDPINAVRVFNEKQVDELILLDITSWISDHSIDFDYLRKISISARMPLTYGGNIRSASEAKLLISMGYEKIALNTAAIDNPSLVCEISKTVGRQSVVVCVDFISSTGSWNLCRRGVPLPGVDIFSYCTEMENLGAGEILAYAIERDGMMNGLDLEFARYLRNSVDCPITICGGVSSQDDFAKLYRAVGVSGVGVGSYFLIKGKHKAVLLSYNNNIDI
jgi:cyclase